MKRKYIIPQMVVESFSASASFLAGSPSQTGEGEYNAGDVSGSEGSTSGGISGSGGNGLIQRSKQFDAWTTWDE